MSNRKTAAERRQEERFTRRAAQVFEKLPPELASRFVNRMHEKLWPGNDISARESRSDAVFDTYLTAATSNGHAPDIDEMVDFALALDEDLFGDSAKTAKKKSTTKKKSSTTKKKPPSTTKTAAKGADSGDKTGDDTGDDDPDGDGPRGAGGDEGEPDAGSEETNATAETDSADETGAASSQDDAEGDSRDDADPDASGDAPETSEEPEDDDPFDNKPNRTPAASKKKATKKATASKKKTGAGKNGNGGTKKKAATKKKKAAKTKAAKGSRGASGEGDDDAPFESGEASQDGSPPEDPHGGTTVIADGPDFFEEEEEVGRDEGPPEPGEVEIDDDDEEFFGLSDPHIEREEGTLTTSNPDGMPAAAVASPPARRSRSRPREEWQADLDERVSEHLYFTWRAAAMNLANVGTEDPVCTASATLQALAHSSDMLPPELDQFDASGQVAEVEASLRRLAEAGRATLYDARDPRTNELVTAGKPMAEYDPASIEEEPPDD